jgi:ribose 5-phosphate isomerase B
MKVGIRADHGGFEMKLELAKLLAWEHHEVVDFGNDVYTSNDDYPDFAIPLARAVVKGDVERGVLVCGSGVGASVAANKIVGARAALCHDHFSARQGVEDDNLNIICFGGRTTGLAIAWECTQDARFAASIGTAVGSPKSMNSRLAGLPDRDCETVRKQAVQE